MQLGESAHLVCAKPSIQPPAWEEKGGEAFEGERQQSTGEAERCWGALVYVEVGLDLCHRCRACAGSMHV